MHGVSGFFVLFLTVGFSIGALEPLPVSLRPVASDPELRIPAGLENRVISAVEQSVLNLPRFRITDEPGASTLTFRIIDFSEDRVWVEDEEGEDDSEEEESSILINFLIAVLFNSDAYEIEDPEGGYWVYDSSVTVELELLQAKSRAKKSALTSTARNDSVVTSRNDVIDQFSGDVETELRRLYVLTGTARYRSNDQAVIDFGETVGVERGQLFIVEDSSSLLRADSIRSEESDTTVVRDWSKEGERNIRTSSTVQELIGGTADLRLILLLDSPSLADSILPGSQDNPVMIGGALEIVARPYSHLFGGGGVRFFGVPDESGRNDFGFGVTAFGGFYPVFTPAFRVAFSVNAGLDIISRPDDTDEIVNIIIPSGWPALEANFVISRSIDLVAGIGYRIAPTRSEWLWTSDEDGGSSEAYFVGGPPSITTAGPFAIAGLRFCFF